MLAASRNDRVIGRNKILTVSIRTKNGFNHIGAPPGKRFAAKDEGLNIIAEIIILNQRIAPNLRVNSKCLVVLKTYGSRPMKFTDRIIINNGVTMEAIPFKLFLNVRVICEFIREIGISELLITRQGAIQKEEAIINSILELISQKIVPENEEEILLIAGSKEEKISEIITKFIYINIFIALKAISFFNLKF